uniref:HD domain-containing protein n=2 Tax=Litorilinea aerophila TaxID=1204385 RepID=A0A540VAC4_9CHLR
MKPPMEWHPRHPAFQALLAALLREVQPVYVVGGVVRDLLLQRHDHLKDLDLVLDQPVLPLARRVADRLGWAFYPLDEARDVARLVFTAAQGEPLICDIARMRGEHIEEDLRSRDFTINAMALAITQPASGGMQMELLDPCGGQADLRRGILRRVSPYCLAEDAVRLVRAVRFMAQFAFTLDLETRVQIQRLAGTVRLASPERIRDELWKAFTFDRPATTVADLASLGLLRHVLPEVAATQGVEQSYPHYQDVYAHTLATLTHMAHLRAWIAGTAELPAGGAWPLLVETLAPWRFHLRQHFAHHPSTGRSRRDWLIWYALFHDVGKPATRTVEELPAAAPDDATPNPRSRSRRYRFLGHDKVSASMVEERLTWLRFSRPEITLAQKVVAHHMRPHLLHASFARRPISRRARYRFFRDTGNRLGEGEVGVDILMLALADYLATYAQDPPPDWDAYLRHVAELLDFAFGEDGLAALMQRPLVDGHTLMLHLNLPAGPQIGRLLEKIQEARAAGEVSTPEEALRFAEQCLHHKGA